MTYIARHLPHWERLTGVIVGLVVLAFVLMPFGRSVNLPLGVLSLIGIWLLVTQWKAIWAHLGLRLLLILIGALWMPQLIALPTAVDVEQALEHAAYFPLYALVAVPIVWAARHDDIGFWLLKFVLVVALVWSIDGVIQFVFGANMLGFPYEGGRLTGIFYPSLKMGVVMAHMLPLVMEAIRRLAAKGNGGWVLSLLPIVGAILLTGSRSAMLVLVVAMVAYGALVVWHYRPRWQYVLSAALIVIVAITTVLTVSPSTRERVMVTAKVFEMDRSAFNQATANRGNAWLAGLQIAQDDPWVGIGVGGFTAESVDRGYTQATYSHLHFYALDVLVSSGMVGLIAYLVAYGGFLFMLWKLGGRRMATGAAIIAVGLALWPLNTHFGFYASYTLAVVWPIIGLATALVVRGEADESLASPGENTAHDVD